MLSKKVLAAAIYSVALALKLGLLMLSTNAFANDGGLDNLQERCIMQSDVEACSVWENEDPQSYARAFPYEYFDLEGLAEMWGVDAKRLEALYGKSPWLFKEQSINSEGGFNPFSVDFVDGEAFSRSDLTDGQAWKWLKYRREEIGLCYEDEQRVNGECVVMLGGE